jgi:hypothetical protein
MGLQLALLLLLPLLLQLVRLRMYEASAGRP